MRTGTAEQLHWLDQTTINGDLETGLLLMERASRGLTDVALQYLETEAEEGELPWAAVFCGTGNNGGDGVACARMLHEAGVKVRAFLVGKREKMTPDSKANEQRLNACGVRLEDFDPEDVDQHLFTCAAHVVIDALFGIGLGRDLVGDVVTAVEWINESDGIVIAADRWGKYKTATTMVWIAYALLMQHFWSGVPAAWALHVALMVLSLGLTLLSGANYLWKNRALIAQAK